MLWRTGRLRGGGAARRGRAISDRVKEGIGKYLQATDCVYPSMCVRRFTLDGFFSVTKLTFQL